jgi:hypothetical protein
MSDQHYKSQQAFLQRMDSGELDGTLGAEIKQLSLADLEEVSRILMEREALPEQGPVCLTDTEPK